MAKDKKNRQGRMIHVRLSDELHQKLRVRAAEQDTTIQELVSSLIADELKRKRRR